ncbi:hypothetical protein Trydic_g13952 [Trypoxylus dichotomus]
MAESKIRILVVGLAASIEFQRSRYYAECLYKSSSAKFSKPDIRPLLNISWNLYLTKVRRRIGGRIWALNKNCVVFTNGNYLGDDQDLLHFSLKYARIRAGIDFNDRGIKELKTLFDRQIRDGKKFAYFSFNIDGQSIGSILFMLYHELVPRASTMFLKRCHSQNHGWCNTVIHRIVKGSWFQVGGYTLRNKRMSCENYVIPHDRRGILSMCHSGKHKQNNVQFTVSLNPTPWMNYKYVAFGQVVQGEEVLRQIEEIPTTYEAPNKTIKIVTCGEYTIPDAATLKHVDMVAQYYRNIDEETGLQEDISDIYDTDSNLSISRYKKGYYCLNSDLKTNLDLMQLPAFLLRLYMEYTGIYSPRAYLAFDEYKSPSSSSSTTSNQLLSDPIPIVETMEFKMSQKPHQVKQSERSETDIDHAEVVQKVTQLDDESIRRSLVPTSSELMQKAEINAMFL